MSFVPAQNEPQQQAADNKRHAEELKREGNKALQDMRYQDAVDLYTTAIAIDPANHILFSNRSAAKLDLALQLEKQQSSATVVNALVTEALEDAEACGKLAEAAGTFFAKAFYRRAQCLKKLGNVGEARDCLAVGVRAKQATEADVNSLMPTLVELEVEVAEKEQAVDDEQKVLAKVDEACAAVVGDKLELVDGEARKHLALLAIVLSNKCKHTQETAIKVLQAITASSTKIQGNADTFARFQPTLTGLAAILSSEAAASVQVEAIRALSTLAVSSAQEMSEKLISAESGLVEPLKQVFSNEQSTPELLKQLFGTTADQAILANVITAAGAFSGQYPDVGAVLIKAGLVDTLLHYLETPGQLREASASSLAFMIGDTHFNEAVEGRIVAKLCETLSSSESDPTGRCGILAALSVLVDHNSQCASALLRAGALIQLTEMLLSSPPGNVLSSALATFVAFASHDFLQTNDLIASLQRLLVAAQAPSSILERNKALAAAFAAVGAKREDASDWLRTHAVSVTLNWVKDADSDTATNGLWLLGNIARNETIVLDLLNNHGAGEAVLKALEARAEEKKIDRLVTAAIGTLRNLAVPRGAKGLLTESGALRVLSKLIPATAKVNNQPALFDSVITLHSLIKGNPSRARAYVAIDPDNNLETLTAVSLGKLPRVCPVAEGEPTTFMAMDEKTGQRDFRVQYEAGRLLVELSQYPEFAKELNTLGAAQTFQLMCESKFDILQREAQAGLKALNEASN